MKKDIPHVRIHDGVWYGTQKPYFGIMYEFDNQGCGVGFDTLAEAFDHLEHLAEQDGFTLDQCVWDKDSDYTLDDRPHALVQATFDF